MSLPDDYLKYPMRRKGMDHDRYPFSILPERKPVTWPGGKKVALWIVPALEFFPLNPSGKPFKAPGSMVTPYPDLRHFTTRDYGNRVGIYRIFRVLEALGLKASVAMNAAVAERYPMLARETVARGHEVIAHGMDMDTLHYGGLDPETERTQVTETLDILSRICHTPIKGWLSPAKSESAATPDLVKAAGFDYICDWANDDMPYAMATASGPLWAMPHSVELSDRQILIDYHHSEKEFVEQVQDQFEVLLQESAKQGGRILCLSLTPYIIGLPYRVQALKAALAPLAGHKDVWNATGSEILKAFANQQ